MSVTFVIPPEVRGHIDKTLAQFAEVPASRWHREVTICLLTPQSSPFRAEEAICHLEERGFFNGALGVVDVAEVLRRRESYIRFHNQKAKRVVNLRMQWPSIARILEQGLSPTEEREHLHRLVDGLGMKEASHALRNIGRRNLAILDRHILRRLVEYGVLETFPSHLSNRKYLEIERSFQRYAETIQESMDVLDLFFWWQGTGLIFK